jgi:hypothetical protein
LGNDDNNDIIWKFKRIVSHHVLTAKDPNYIGSPYKIMVEWENFEPIMEPLQITAKDNPVTCAVYVKDNGLLDAPGWKQYNSMEKWHKKFT